MLRRLKFRSGKQSIEEEAKTGAGSEAQVGATLAPIDDGACVRLLAKRGLIDDLVQEWPAPDDGWLDYCIVGKLTTAEGTPVLGFLLLSNRSPQSEVVGGTARVTRYAEPLEWDFWNSRNCQLKSDQLHLLSFGVEDSCSPVGSYDLGAMTAPSTLLRKDASDDSEEFVLELRSGGSLTRFHISGKLQAMRWRNAVKAALLASLSAADAMENKPSDLVEALQAFDRGVQLEKTRKIRQHSRQALLAKEKLFQSFLSKEKERQFCEPALASLLDRLARARDMSFEAKVTLLLQADGGRKSIRTMHLLKLFNSLTKLPKLLLSAAVRKEPPRADVLDFWKDTYHVPFCKCMSMLWQIRSTSFSSAELLQYAYAVHSYWEYLNYNFVKDQYLRSSILACATIYANRFGPHYLALSESVSRFADVVMADGGFTTNSAYDLMTLLGPVLEVAVVGPEEMRSGSSAIISDALHSFLSVRDERLRAVEAQGNEPLLLSFLFALFADSEQFLECIDNLMRETNDANLLFNTTFGNASERFSSDTMVFCDRLVGILLRRSRAMAIYGKGSLDEVLAVDLNALTSSVLIPAVRDFVAMIDYDSRRTFVDRVLGYFVAVEVSALFSAESSHKADDCKKIVLTFQQHRDALYAVGKACLTDSRVDIAAAALNETQGETQLHHLKAVFLLDAIITILEIPSTKLEISRLETWATHECGGLISREIGEGLLALRSDVDAAKKQALNTLPKSVGAAAGVAKDICKWVTNKRWVSELISNNASTGLSSGIDSSEPSWDSAWLHPCQGAWTIAKEKVLDALTKPVQSATVPQDAGEKKPQAVESLDDFLAGLDFDDEDFAEEVDDEVDPEMDEVSEEVSAPSSVVEAAAPSGDTADDLLEEALLRSGEEEEEDDEMLLGYLYVGTGVKDPSGNKHLRRYVSWSEWWEGWALRFFMVRKDMSENRSLSWYRDQTDKAALGFLPFNRLGAILAIDEKSGERPYVLKLEVLRGPLDVAIDVLELRSQYMHERDVWLSGLKLLLERDTAQHKLVEQRSEPVYIIKDSIRLLSQMKTHAVVAKAVMKLKAKNAKTT